MLSFFKLNSICLIEQFHNEAMNFCTLSVASAHAFGKIPTKVKRSLMKGPRILKVCLPGNEKKE